MNHDVWFDLIHEQDHCCTISQVAFLDRRHCTTEANAGGFKFGYFGYFAHHYTTKSVESALAAAQAGNHEQTSVCGWCVWLLSDGIFCEDNDTVAEEIRVFWIFSSSQ